MTVVRLAALLARMRLRAVWNALVRVPRRRSLRLAWLLVLLGPVGYVGLFAAALEAVSEVATRAEQAAMLALVAGCVVAASAAGKMASNEAVVGGSGENEFLLARPVAIFLALIGTRVDTATKGFMAWFGPKGVATMTFSLIVLGDAISANERIFNIAALAVMCSILLHGLSDTPAANWIARRAEVLESAESRAADAASSA